MQYQQPSAPFFSNFQNSPQMYPAPPPIAPPGYPPNWPQPEVVGDGEMMSVVQPDGSIQHYFVPLNRWTPGPANTGAWLIRNNMNNVNPKTFLTGIQQPIPQNIGYYNNLAGPQYRGYPMQFHNNQYTSTQDIEYFMSHINTYDLVQKISAEAQCNYNPRVSRKRAVRPRQCEVVLKDSNCC